MAEYLKRKDFTRRPHIALLGAQRRTIAPTTSLLPEEFFEEHLEEEALQRLIPNLTGYRVSLERVSEPAQIKITYSFYFRVAPPTVVALPELRTSEQFRYVKLALEIANDAGQASLQIFDGAKQAELFSDTMPIALQKGRGKIEIPARHFSKASVHLQTLDLPYFYSPKGRGDTGNGATLAVNFALSFSILNKDGLSELSVYLENLTPRFLNRRTSKDLNGFLPNDLLDLNDEPWTIGALLEFEGSLDLQGYKLKTDEKPHGILGITTINSVFAEQDRANLFRDYVIVRETAKKIKRSPRSSYEVFSNLISEFAVGRGIETTLAKAIGEAIASALERMGAKFPFTFQEQGVEIALDSIESTKVALAITARTASGKTLAFLLSLIHI